MYIIIAVALSFRLQVCSSPTSVNEVRPVRLLLIGEFGGLCPAEGSCMSTVSFSSSQVGFDESSPEGLSVARGTCSSTVLGANVEFSVLTSALSRPLSLCFEVGTGQLVFGAPPCPAFCPWLSHLSPFFGLLPPPPPPPPPLLPLSPLFHGLLPVCYSLQCCPQRSGCCCQMGCFRLWEWLDVEWAWGLSL